MANVLDTSIVTNLVKELIKDPDTPATKEDVVNAMYAIIELVTQSFEALKNGAKL